jgi:hypothetical protein
MDNSFKIDLTVMGWECLNWILLTQDRVQPQALANKVMDIRSIQGDSEGKVSVLGGDSMGKYEKKEFHLTMSLNSKLLSIHSCLNLKIKKEK